MSKKCGYIALLGRPNAGKSTLLNSLLGTKLAIVSNKPQTTRNRVLGVRTEGESQALFLDTPGIHTRATSHLNLLMNKTAWKTLQEADLVCYLVDLTQGWSAEDEKWLLEIFKKYRKKLMLVATKSDKLTKSVMKQGAHAISERLKQLLVRLQENPALLPCCEWVGPVPFCVSAKRPEEVSSLRQFLFTQLPFNDWFYDEDSLTDKPERFICSEFIREQVFRQLGQELPYKIAVVVDSFKETGTLVRIQATLLVESESHKGIVIGKKGQRLKEIGTESRLSLEKHLLKKVFLEIFVKVKENWTENPNLVFEFAHLLKTED